MTIETWMPALASVLAAVPDVEQVHTYEDLPGTLSVFPCVVVMPLSGSQSVSAGGLNIAIHQLRLTLFVSAQIIPEAAGRAVPFIARMRTALAASVTLGGLVAHLLPVGPPAPFYEGPGAIAYADKTLMGINFTVEVKELEAITVSA